MKKIAISKRLWRELQKLRNQWGFTTIPRMIEYLINYQASLPQENLQVIHHLVDELINAKNLEVKMVLPDINVRVDQIFQEKQSMAVPEEKKEQPTFLFQCMECGNMPFSVGEVISNKTGITCPHCKHIHSITVNRKSSDDSILIRSRK